MSVRGNVDAVLYCTQGNMPLWLHSRLKTGVICSSATPGWSQGPAGCQGRRMTREMVGWTEDEEALELIPTRPSQFSHPVVLSHSL